ncbi:MAG: RNA polymerase sigma factor [Faecousia sp.]
MLTLFLAMIDDKPDQETFENIYHSYRKQMLLVAQRVLNNPQDAEDALQTTLLKLAQHIKSVPTGDPKQLRAYVLTAAKNTALSMLREKKAREKTVDISELQLPSEEEALFEQVQASMDYELLLRAFRRLKPQYREVLMLICVQGQSVQETAELLHRKAGTVRQQLSRGKQLAVALCREEGMSFEDHRTLAV